MFVYYTRLYSTRSSGCKIHERYGCDVYVFLHHYTYNNIGTLAVSGQWRNLKNIIFFFFWNLLLEIENARGIHFILVKRYIGTIYTYTPL